MQMEANALQLEKSTPQRQEYVKVDPRDSYVQTNRWAGQEVSKGKISSCKTASGVHLRFGITFSHSTCAKAAKDQSATPRRKGRLR